MWEIPVYRPAQISVTNMVMARNLCILWSKRAYSTGTLVHEKCQSVSPNSSCETNQSEPCFADRGALKRRIPVQRPSVKKLKYKIPTIFYGAIIWKNTNASHI